MSVLPLCLYNQLKDDQACKRAEEMAQAASRKLTLHFDKVSVQF